MRVGYISPGTVAGQNDRDVTVDKGLPALLTPEAGSVVDVAAPASATAAVVTYPAIPGYRHVLANVRFSYSGGAPTGGNIQVADGSGVIVNQDITGQGPGFLDFRRPKVGIVGQSMTVTLASGGSGVSGKISCDHWLTPAYIPQPDVKDSGPNLLYYVPLNAVFQAALI